MLKIARYALRFLLILTVVSILQASGGKRVHINKNTQTLTAYEEDRVVLRSRISTGKARSPTPSGRFQVGVKDRMHRSRLYDNAPMPYSIQFNNNYFIHGFGSVPSYPASHGCVRMPIEKAQRLFEWITPGTPVTVSGSQKHSLKSKSKSSSRKKMNSSKTKLSAPQKPKTARSPQEAPSPDSFEILE